MYTLRIISRQKGGRHVEVTLEHYSDLTVAIKRGRLLSQDNSLTVDLYKGTTFIQHFGHGCPVWSEVA